jgi:predicted MFS family arabinose efflux permease
VRDQLRTVLTVARDPSLARVELAYFGFNMAEYATWVAIMVWAYGLGGPGAATLVALIQLIPAGLFAPVAAYAADRYRRDRVLFVGCAWQALSLGGTAFALRAAAPPAVILGLAIVAAISITVTRPIQGVILPSITHSPADLTAANAVSSLAETVGIFVGPLAGGLILAQTGPGEVFALFAVVSAVAAILVSGLPAIRPPVAAARAASVRGAIEATFGGFGVLRDRPRVRALVVVLTSTMVLIGALDLLFVATAVDLLHLGGSWAGFFYAAFGFGGVVGASASVVLVGRRRLTPALATGAAICGGSVSVVGLVPAALGAPLLFLCAGAGFSLATVAGRTLLQRTAPEASLARVFGVLEGMTMFAYALGTLATGAVISMLGIAPALVLAGLLVPAVVVVTWSTLASVDRDAKPIDVEALALLRRLPIFAPLSAPSMERILAGATWLDVPMGTAVIREGDLGDRYYVIGTGRVAASAAGRLLSERGPGEGFGEIALLRDVPRTATVTALTPLRLVSIERGDFLEAVTGHAESRERAEAVVIERLAVGSGP